jgi:hypothetical protein
MPILLCFAYMPEKNIWGPLFVSIISSMRNIKRPICHELCQIICYGTLIMLTLDTHTPGELRWDVALIWQVSHVIGIINASVICSSICVVNQKGSHRRVTQLWYKLMARLLRMFDAHGRRVTIVISLAMIRPRHCPQFPARLKQCYICPFCDSEREILQATITFHFVLTRTDALLLGRHAHEIVICLPAKGGDNSGHRLHD